MEEKRRNLKCGKQHWADTKARMQKSCYREGGIPIRDQWTRVDMRVWVNGGAFGRMTEK